MDLVVGAFAATVGAGGRGGVNNNGPDGGAGGTSSLSGVTASGGSGRYSSGLRAGGQVGPTTLFGGIATTAGSGGSGGGDCGQGGCPAGWGAAGIIIVRYEIAP